jgi:hypothetical protein
VGGVGEEQRKNEGKCPKREGSDSSVSVAQAFTPGIVKKKHQWNLVYEVFEGGFSHQQNIAP